MVCPNCGYEFEGGRCPNCGRSTGGAATANRVIAVIVAVFLVLPIALFGACTAFFGASSFLSPGGWQFGLTVLLIAALAFGAAYGLGILVKNLWK